VRRVGRLLFLLALIAAIVVGALAFRQRIADAPRAQVRGDGRPALACLGDSLTAGDGAPSSQSYPAWLQRRLDGAGYRMQVINAGHSGDRVADGLARLQRDVLDYHPVLAIVELGSNDPGHTVGDTWQSQLGTIVSHLQARHVRVILGGLDEPGMGVRYRAIAARYGVPVVWFTANLWSRPGLWANAHHPNGTGYSLVMDAFWPDVVRLLGKPQPGA
jgi:acyl-CoA thioesterase-1